MATGLAAARPCAGPAARGAAAGGHADDGELVDFLTPGTRQTVVVSPLPGRIRRGGDEGETAVDEDGAQAWLHEYFSAFGPVYSVKVVHEAVALVRFFLAADADAARRVKGHHRGQLEFRVRAGRADDRTWPRVPMALGKCCAIMESLVGRYQLSAEPRPVAFLRLDDGRVVLRTRAILEIPGYDLRVVGTGFAIYDDAEEKVLAAAKGVVPHDESQSALLRKALEEARVPPRPFRQLGEAMHNVFNVARVDCFLQLRLHARGGKRGGYPELLGVYRDFPPEPAQMN